jgi:signal transduction histidine kinase
MTGASDEEKAAAAGPDRPRVRAVAAHEVRHDASETAVLVERLAECMTDRPSAEAVELLDRLRAAAQRLCRTVDDLLDGPDDLRQLQLAPVRVEEVVQDVIAVHDPQGHEITHDVASLVVRLDRVKFERIVDNLLLNALHHTPAGCSVRIRLAGDPSGVVQLVVEDDGPGLPADVLERALDPEVPEGAGGLGVVALLAALHGGSVEAEPVGPDGGLRVTVELPTGSRSADG